jgi:hypothetical protein
MKKIASLLIILACGYMLFAFSSCRKYEEQPKDWFTSELAFDTLDKNGIVAGFNLNNIYTFIPNGFNRIEGDFLDASTDDAVPTRLSAVGEYFARGIVTAASNPEENPGTGYGLSQWANSPRQYIPEIYRTCTSGRANKTILEIGSPLSPRLFLLGTFEKIWRRACHR